MEKLLCLVPQLTGILQDNHPDYPKAIDKTLNDVRRKIHQFIENLDLDINEARAVDLRKRFVNWINPILRCDTIDLYRALKPPLSLNNTIAGEEWGTTFIDRLADPQTLDDPLQQEERNKQQLVLKRYVERDPEGRLRQCYPANCQDCNCQVIAKERYLNEPGVSVPALAKKYGINEQTIYSYWQRNCRCILQEVVDNYHQYLYLLPVTLSQWLEDVFDASWQNVEDFLGAKSVYLMPSFRISPVKRGKLINSLADNPVALVAAVTPKAEHKIGICLRIYPTGEQEYLPPYLQLIVFDEFGEPVMKVQSRSRDKWIQMQLSGTLGEGFGVQIALGDASFIEDFII